MISFPNAKINLGLNIISKRDDGYHNIESCFYPIPLKDVLEIIPATKFSFQSTGLAIDGDPKHNLVVKAFKMLQKDFGLENIAIHLHKIIPMGAGLGGGSADAAFVLKMIDEEFQLLLGDQYLETLALELGSDCPFFIQNQPVIASGRGEIFEPIAIDLSNYHLILVKPDIHVSTKEAYTGVKPKTPEVSVKEIIEKKKVSEWKDLLVNDFELGVFEKYPEIGAIKQALYGQGAVYASMTGSGSAVYGLFKEKPSSLAFKNNYPYFSFQLS